MAIKPTLIELLTIVRNRKGWTQKETAARLAKYSGVPVSERSVVAWTTGTRSPHPLMQKAIKKFIQENE